MSKKPIKSVPKKTSVSEDRIRFLWRTKYPWLFVFYIFMFGILIGILQNTSEDPIFITNLLMMAMFTSFVFLYIFYIYGVRPDELEHHFK